LLHVQIVADEKDNKCASILRCAHIIAADPRANALVIFSDSIATTAPRPQIPCLVAAATIRILIIAFSSFLNTHKRTLMLGCVIALRYLGRLGVIRNRAPFGASPLLL
jgi:hypothetical protein